MKENKNKLEDIEVMQTTLIWLAKKLGFDICLYVSKDGKRVLGITMSGDKKYINHCSKFHSKKGEKMTRKMVNPGRTN